MATKRTVPETALFIADVVGLQEGTMTHLARRLREGGYLSQFGHGRGAAQATSRDAATLLLTAMTGIRPLHSTSAALALRECRRPEFDDPSETGKTFAEAASDPISELESLLDGRVEIDAVEAGVDVHTRGGIGVTFFNGSDSVSYSLDPSSPDAERLLEALGRKPVFGMRWHARCDGKTLLEIVDWLNAEDEDATA